MKNKNLVSANRGVAHIAIIIIGILISAVLVGLFTYKGKGLFPSINQTGNNAGTAAVKPTTYPNIPSGLGTYPKPDCGITILMPVPGQIIGSGFQIVGTESGCGWTPFEAQAGTVQAFLASGVKLSNPIPLSIGGDWMKLPVNFAASLSFTQTPPPGSDGFLLFKNENPSGSNLQYFKVSVKFQ
jgi:hypothetical protein